MKKKFLYSLLFVILGYVPLCANSEIPITIAGGDNCANATLITCGTSFTNETTVGATNDPFPTCNTNGTLASGSPNVWYTFVATSNSTTVTTCDNTNFDSEIGIFSGTCGSLVCVAGSDGDGCGTSDETVTFATTVGATYYIMIQGHGGATGTFSLSLTCASVGDPCSSITPLSCGTPVSVSLSGSGSWNISSCGFSTPGQEKVYSFTATTTGAHTLAVTSTNSTFVDYFFKDASGGCSSTGWTCIDDISTSTNVNFNLTAGVTYYILVDDENATASSQTFQINCPPSCPVLSSAPANVTIVNSICTAPTCSPTGGDITAPVGACPTGSTIQYSVNGGAWSNTVPTYNQSVPVLNIQTRCSCDIDPLNVSPASVAVSTAPGACPPECTCPTPTGSCVVAATVDLDADCSTPTLASAFVTNLSDPNLTLEVARENTAGSGNYGAFAPSVTFTGLDLPNIADCAANGAPASYGVRVRLTNSCSSSSIVDCQITLRDLHRNCKLDASYCFR